MDGVSSMRTLALIPKHNTNVSVWIYVCDLFLGFFCSFFFLERKYNTPLEVYMKRHIEYILIVDTYEAKKKGKRLGEGLGDDASCVFLRLQIGLLHWLHFLLLGFGLENEVEKQ